MKNTFRALFGVSALALLLVATPVMAAEVNVTAENTTTGADSDNENNHDVTDDSNVVVTNVGDVLNDADADVETGNNEQTRNTTGEDLTSGAVDASTDWASLVNAGAAMMDHGDGLEVGADFVNDTTGADSNNENNLDVENDASLVLTNVADILNDLELDANTGDNEQSRNTEAGDLETGDVMLDSMIANWANNDSGFSSSAAGSTTVDVSGENTKTGADSNNENNVDVTNNANHVITNVANIETDIDVDANTGNNEQTRNTTAGSIKTGSVEVTTEVENQANNGSSHSASNGNHTSVTVGGANDTTGADSNNENNVDVENNASVVVTNTADVSNDLDVDANTGDNEQSRNTTGGDIETGDVTIDFTVLNEVNSN